MPPHWLTALAWASLGTAVVCAVVILSDVYGRGYRQPMPVMEAVWPVTALYLGPLAVAGYWRYGQPATHRWRTEHDRDTPPDKPRWATTAVGVCTGCSCRSAWPSDSPPRGRPTPGSSTTASRKQCNRTASTTSHR